MGRSATPLPPHARHSPRGRSPGLRCSQIRRRASSVDYMPGRHTGAGGQMPRQQCHAAPELVDDSAVRTVAPCPGWYALRYLDD
jgi:hypothetical protein